MERNYVDSMEVNATINRFTNLLKLNDVLQGSVINKICSSNAYCRNTNKEFSKLNVICTLGLNFKVEIDTFFPRAGVLSVELDDIYKMTIYVHDTDIRNEIRSFTNYLQRQKNFSLTIIVLKKLAVAVADRKLILDMLYLHTDGNIVTKNCEDGGVSLFCKVHEIKYFKCKWKIHLNCSTQRVLDIIDFTVTKKDSVFHNLVFNAMNYLILPNLAYNVKVDYWSTITDAVNVKMKEPVIEIIENDSWDQKDYLLVRNLSEVDNEVIEQYEILESDNEDCHIIEN